MSDPDGEENFVRAGRGSSRTKSVHSIEVLIGKSLHIVEIYHLTIITPEDIEEKEVVNEEKHTWTRRHFWALHFATLLIAMGCSAFLIFWLNWDSGISMEIVF